MNFEWNYGCGDAFKTLSTLIKFNQGAWKSTKQRTFMDQKILIQADGCYPRDADNARMFGIELVGDQKGLILEGFSRFASYGHKSLRFSSWFFVLDEVGIVAQYKLKHTYKAGGSSIDPAGTKTLFKRQETVEAPVAPVVEVKETFHVGVEGTRQVLFLKEKKVIDRGYGNFGQQFLSILEDDAGNTFFYNAMLGQCDEEERKNGLELNVTIKSHIVTKSGDKVTVIARPALTKGQKQLLVLSR